MKIHQLRARMAQRDSFSILETVDVETGVRTVLKEFDYVIEAPNWTQDGNHLVYNSRGKLYTYELATGTIKSTAITTTFFRRITAKLQRNVGLNEEDSQSHQ